MNRGHEIDALDYHDQVDRIEVPFAGETAAEVGLWIGGGEELTTYPPLRRLLSRLRAAFFVRRNA